jgi:hypothetical protein
LRGSQLVLKEVKKVGSVDDGSRVSTTSGLDAHPQGKQTWSVGSQPANRESWRVNRHNSARSILRGDLHQSRYNPTGANAVAVG